MLRTHVIRITKLCCEICKKTIIRNDSRWLIANILGLQLPVKPQKRKDATLSDKFWSLMEQKIPSGGAPQVASTTLVAGAAVLLAPWHSSSRCRVNRTGSPSDQGLEEPHGSPVRLLWPVQQLCRHLGVAALGAE